MYRPSTRPRCPHQPYCSPAAPRHPSVKVGLRARLRGERHVRIARAVDLGVFAGELAWRARFEIELRLHCGHRVYLAAELRDPERADGAVGGQFKMDRRADG